MNTTAVYLNQRGTGHGARGVIHLCNTAIIVGADTGTCTKHMTATACVINSLTRNTAFIDMYFSTIAYMAILTTTIDRTIDDGAIVRNVVSRGTTNIDNRLIDIAQEEVGYIPVAW